MSIFPGTLINVSCYELAELNRTPLRDSKQFYNTLCRTSNTNLAVLYVAVEAVRETKVTNVPAGTH